jgi:hypothetical protein
LGAGKAEWRHRDVLYDSIAVTIGWGWILFWPVIVAAIPAAIFLHVKYRKAPRSYLIPRYGWRFWAAVCGAHLAAVIHRQFALHALDGGEAVIENCIPQDIAGWQPHRRNEVVPE